MRRLKGLLGVVVLGAVLVVGCAQEEELSVTASFFEGLDEAVVEEVLANPVAHSRIARWPTSDRRESSAQGIVTNFIVCRDALRVYQGWRNTGVAPSLEPLPRPINPREPSYSYGEWSHAYLTARIDSGEIDKLHFWLTATGSCGHWIPAIPGDPSGPTIRDIVMGEES